MQTMTGRDVVSTFRREWRRVCENNPRLARDKPAMREAFSAYVDDLARSGRISERVAFNVTLD